MCEITCYQGVQWLRQSDDMIVEYLWNVYNVKKYLTGYVKLNWLGIFIPNYWDLIGSQTLPYLVIFPYLVMLTLAEIQIMVTSTTLCLSLRVPFKIYMCSEQKERQANPRWRNIFASLHLLLLRCLLFVMYICATMCHNMAQNMAHCYECILVPQCAIM